MSVILETSCGSITIDLYVKERPRCCLNFLKLCKIKYYNFSLFHSVQRNLVAQTGDPDGTGKGGKSVFSLLYGEQAAYFEAETLPRIKHKKFGTVSMVNGGNRVHGSQFFLTLAPNIDYLDSQGHTVFGEVAEGFEVLNTFNETIVNSNNQPYKDIRIFHTVVLDDPFEDPQGLEKYIPDRSPSPTAERLRGGCIGVDEEIDDEKGLTAEELDQQHKEREAKANAQILEMIGDLPDVDVKPPDNVLFVCKLNPVTTSEDLEIIFSRFGRILSCEVIKDQKTEASLQYAFIEFEKPEDCEKAYFKMDNVLIDDRRIHVDFSQSVSKLPWKPKGKQDAKGDDDEERAKLRIKHPDDRRNNKYDLVFEEIETGTNRKRGRSRSKDKQAHKKKHKKKNRSSSSEHNSTSSERDTRIKMSHTKHGHNKSISEERSLSKHSRKQRSPSTSYEDRSKEKHDKRNQRPSRPKEEKSKQRTKQRHNSTSSEESRKEKHKKRDHSPSRFSSADRSKLQEKKKYRDESPPAERQNKRQYQRRTSSASDTDNTTNRYGNDLRKDKDKNQKKKNRSPSPVHSRKHRSPSTSYEDRSKEKHDKRNQRHSRLTEEKSEKKTKQRNNSASSEESRKEKQRHSRPIEEKSEKRTKQRNNSTSSEESRKEKHKKRDHSPSRFSSPDRSKGQKKKKYGDDSPSAERQNKRQNRRCTSSASDTDNTTNRYRNDVHKDVDHSRKHGSKRK